MTSPQRPVALISGGAGGVGLACARRLGHTHELVLTDVVDDRLQAAVEELRRDGIEATGIAADTTQRDQVIAVVGAAAQRGGLGIIVLAAGLSPNMADAMQIMRVNLVGMAYFLEAASPYVTADTTAVCISSVAGHRRWVDPYDRLLADPLADDFLERLGAEANPDGDSRLAYTLSKRGVMVLVQRLACEWGPRGARIVSVSPGLIVDTRMGKFESERGAKDIKGGAVLKQAVTADAIAEACVWLTCGPISLITGCDLLVDAGMLAGLRFASPPEVSQAFDHPAR
jgi:NAD(P)-dependent dehydrogenase (short-subunit alcohol dehydrogenase family)